jgi:UDP-glucuronate 4-epimerase
MAQLPSPQERITLVTGGAGFIGSNLAGRLLERGETVICLDNFNDYYSPALKRRNISGYLDNPSFRLVEGDIRDRELVMSLFAEQRPQRVAHLAAMANVRYSVERASLYVDVNIQGSINLMDAARQNGVENFVFASTSSVYGRTEQSPFTEDQPTSTPLAPYPATKKAVEVMGAAYHNMFGLNFTAVRFFTAYGPRNRPDMMAFMVTDNIVRGREVVLYDDGEMYRDWTFVEDIAGGVAAALDTPLGYEIINLGRGEPVRLGDFVAIIEELAGRQARIKTIPAPPSEPPMTFANTDKARALLGYNPRVSIREGLEKTWAWYQTVTDLLDPDR